MRIRKLPPQLSPAPKDVEPVLAQIQPLPLREWRPAGVENPPDRLASAPPAAFRDAYDASPRNSTLVNPPPDPLLPDPRRWLRQPVGFDVQQYPLPDLLREFAASQGVACRVSDRLSGIVSGMSKFRDPGEFLDMLCRAQRLNWYFDGSTVFFFSDSELASRLFQLNGDREAILRRTLIELELFDARFSWRVAEGGSLLLVQGPEPYLERIAELLDKQTEVAAAAARERKLGVFRLKHAWAAERSITSGDGEVKVPGVADILRQIIAGDGGQAASPAASPTPPGTPRLKMGTGMIARRANANAEAAEPPVASSETPFIQADTRLNAVLIWDYEENMARHQQMIELLDQPLALVEIRAAIVDVEVSRTRDLGVSWEYNGDGHTWNNKVGANPTGSNPLDRVTGSGFQYATIYTHGLDQFMARVSALEEDGVANVLSRPSVLTQDNIQATLEHNETFYVTLFGENTVDLADITTGMTLRVTPHVIDNTAGGVQLAVYIVNGSDTDSTPTGYMGGDIPRVRQSTISTQAVVYEGESLVIGGYYNEERRVNNTGVPGLQKIPGLGALFRDRKTTNSKTERLFVLSPRIIQPGASIMKAGSEAERAFDHSPAKKMLDGPAESEKNVPEKRRWWQRRDNQDKTRPSMSLIDP
ncbi:MAG: type III secretion system outer membrane ring subunit SctC [Planctomycetota bacterium]|jgi:type III secretion protein C|nr:type III secretion system outer membrane ring subunit SctC [Planctomycetota bacterium]